MDLVEYAKSELERAGLFDKDSDYGGMLGESALEIVTIFSHQGHSGSSAGIVTELVTKLLRYEPLTPLTYESEEWWDVSELSGTPLWQNKRDFKIFSVDGGKTHYSVEH
jgi:hypothetical protein